MAIADISRDDVLAGLEVHPNILTTIGNTPLVRLNSVGRDLPCQLLAKVEFFNPGGSVKDRIGPAIIAQAEKSGALQPGGTIVEATSGNTGVGLAIAAAVKGYRCVFVMPDKMSQEKIQLLRAYGARVVVTPTAVEPDDPRSYYRVAERLVAETPNAILADQYRNPVNPQAHYETTGPEIWEQTEGQVRFFFAGYGTCGTLTGVGRALKERNPQVQVIAIEPRKGHRIPGLKNLTESKPPGILDSSVIDHVIRVDDEPAYAMTKRLFREEGLIVGPSTGAIVHAAAEFGCNREGVAVAISPDSGFKYASYFADILGDEGMPQG